MLSALSSATKAHPDVVCHERANDGDIFIGAVPGIVERIVEPVRAERAKAFQSGEVLQRAVCVDCRRKRRRVRRDDEIRGQSPLEREVRHAERAVLVGVMPVAHVVR